VNNTQRRALAILIGEEGFAVTRGAVDAVLEDIRADIEAGSLPEMPESIDDLDDTESYVKDAVNAVYSRTGDRGLCDRYREGLLDAVDLALRERLAFSSDGDTWADRDE